MKACGDCGALGEPGTTCRECGRGIHCEKVAKPRIVWIIEEASRSFDWLVIAESEQACLREFKRMWNDWCKNAGADPYYWGHKGDKFADITPREVELGAGYMDRERYR